MDANDRNDDLTYRVVVNHEEQYSIWPVDKDLPHGWDDAGFSGPKTACLEHVNLIWTDMRPLSVRQAMEEDSAR